MFYLPLRKFRFHDLTSSVLAVKLRPLVAVAALVVLGLPLKTIEAAPHQYFGIVASDAKTGQPISCVRLTTTHGIVYFTDDLGVAAIYEPGWMGENLWFTIERDGYWFPDQQLTIDEGGIGFIRASELPPRVAAGTTGRSASSLVLPGLARDS